VHPRIIVTGRAACTGDVRPGEVMSNEQLTTP
jgi:hypothetical protein